MFTVVPFRGERSVGLARLPTQAVGVFVAVGVDVMVGVLVAVGVEVGVGVLVGDGNP